MVLFLLAVLAALQRITVASDLLLTLSYYEYTITGPLTLLFIQLRQPLPFVIAMITHGIVTLLISLQLGINPLTLVTQALEVSSTLTSQGTLDLFAVAQTLDLPSPVPILGDLVILAATVYVLIRYPKADLIATLSLVSFVSLAIVYHRQYDYVALLFPLIFLFDRTQKAPGLKVMIGLCLICTWLIDGIIGSFLIRYQSQFSDLFATLLPLYFWLKVVFFYGALILNCRYIMTCSSPSEELSSAPEAYLHQIH